MESLSFLILQEEISGIQGPRLILKITGKYSLSDTTPGFFTILLQTEEAATVTPDPGYNKRNSIIHLCTHAKQCFASLKPPMLWIFLHSFLNCFIRTMQITDMHKTCK